ncbi:MAG: hypothetical protein WCA39_01610 [Nitrososphaeraceae archaeon]
MFLVQQSSKGLIPSMKRLKNYTYYLDDKLREVIDFVKPNNNSFTSKINVKIISSSDGLVDWKIYVTKWHLH